MTGMITPLLRVAEKTLDVAAARHKAITQNIANYDTPGYQTRDVDFGQQLSRLLASVDSENATVQSRVVPGLIQRPDGNDVNIDRESLLLAQNQLTYSTALQLAKAEFKRIHLAIQEP